MEKSKEMEKSVINVETAKMSGKRQNVQRYSAYNKMIDLESKKKEGGVCGDNE